MERCFVTLLGLNTLLFIYDIFHGAVSAPNSGFIASSDCIINNELEMMRKEAVCFKGIIPKCFKRL
jgi:hypothetical protein